MNYTDLVSAFKIMGQGMTAVFTAMIVISIVVYLFILLNKR